MFVSKVERKVRILFLKEEKSFESPKSQFPPSFKSDASDQKLTRTICRRQPPFSHTLLSLTFSLIFLLSLSLSPSFSHSFSISLNIPTFLNLLYPLFQEHQLLSYRLSSNFCRLLYSSNYEQYFSSSFPHTCGLSMNHFISNPLCLSFFSMSSPCASLSHSLSLSHLLSLSLSLIISISHSLSLSFHSFYFHTFIFDSIP